MDSGPFRSPQPSERRVPTRSEPTVRQAEPVQPTREEPRSSYRADPPTQPPVKRSIFKRFILPVIIVLAIIGLAVIGWSVWNKAQDAAGTGINSSRYQAVFFANGEVYFGKLQSFGDEYLKLTDIFYLQNSSTKNTEDETTASSADATDAQLIKLGNEAYGPEDTMIISRDQVTRYMNMKADSKVVQLINKYVAK